jgi:hypothetical protein
VSITKVENNFGFKSSSSATNSLGVADLRPHLKMIFKMDNCKSSETKAGYNCGILAARRMANPC